MWAIVAGPREYDPENEATARGWEYVIEASGQRRTICAELSDTAADITSLAEQSATAIRTKGRSAIEPFLIRDEPPDRVIVNARGIYPG
jgi:hypothetical protein